MKFIDEVSIFVEAGHGGTGIKSFWREKFVPLGGPDGGNGGRGGSVILVADRNHSTLLDFQFRPRWKAENGDKGQGSRKDGRAGADLIVKVPVGTQVYRAKPDGSATHNPAQMVCDLNRDGAQFVLATGGRGGKGNAFFKSPTNRAPEHFQPGEPGEQGTYLLSLKLVADVGLVGFPNAGKSTLVSRVSAAKPKIADYPFTTLTPNLGVVRAKGGRTFVMADIPGLVPGAHTGKGLGIKFLKHVERTRVIVHVIDPHQRDESGEPLDPIQSFEAICHELRSFSPTLADRPHLVALSKSDTLTDQTEAQRTIDAFADRGITCILISAVSGANLDQLVETICAKLAEVPRDIIQESEDAEHEEHAPQGSTPDTQRAESEAVG